MKTNKWWASQDEERYWLEITDRDDLGTDLNAPQLKDDGKEYWGYSLITEADPGDIVFHYHKNKQSIIAWSVISGSAWEDSVIWGAHGTTARGAGVTPYQRPGWRRGIDKFSYLDSPVTLEDMRLQEPSIRKIKGSLTAGHKGSLYLPFEFSDKRPLRPSQPYFSKLPAEIVALFPALKEGSKTATQPTTRKLLNPGDKVGTAYRAADEEVAVSTGDPFKQDPALVERGLKGHRRTQNALASFLESHGITPRSPAPDEPNYDLAWNYNGKVFVAEVKSTTKSNEEKQLRLGLGQVLRYSDLFSDEVTPVLVPEQEVYDQTWYSTCEKVGVLLAIPGKFEALL